MNVSTNLIELVIFTTTLAATVALVVTNHAANGIIEPMIAIMGAAAGHAMGKSS